MKRIYFVTVLLLSFIFVLAQQDEKSKNILDQVSKKTSSFQTIQADFSFTMKNTDLGINEKNDGNIILKGQKYNIDLPGVGIKIFSNGKTIWNYMKNGNQVTISNIDDDGGDLMDPASLFNIYEKGFKSKFVNDVTIGGKSVHVIELLPENNDMDVLKVSVNIDKNTMMIQSAVLFSTDGNQYGIEVRNMVTNKSFSDSSFDFDTSKYSDIEIIDLR